MGNCGQLNDLDFEEDIILDNTLMMALQSSINSSQFTYPSDFLHNMSQYRVSSASFAAIFNL